MKHNRRTVVSALLGLPFIPALARSAEAAWHDSSEIKALYDPHNLFRVNQNIRPA